MIHEMGFWRSQWHMNVQLQFGHSNPFCFFRVWNNIDIASIRDKWIQHSCTHFIYYCPLGWRKYCRTGRYMGERGGGLQLSISCALITMISQFTMLHIQKVTLLDSILFFGMQMNAECCLHLQDEGHCTEPHKLTNNESCGSQTCSAFTIFHCWYVLLSVFSWCFCNIGMWQAGNASGISIWEPVSNVFFFMFLLSENHRKSKWRTTRSKPNCPRWNQSSLVFWADLCFQLLGKC